MKKVFKIILFIFLFITIMTVSKVSTYAYGDLDYIDEYNIKVTPLKDGSLDMEFDIVWTVLDGKSEGPLTWVKIGIPNYHAESIQSLSPNIQKIRYYSDSGSFIRIDFKQRYTTGSVVHFSFKYNQSYMYHLYEDKVIYDYNPGWFDDILVGKCTLSWKMEGISQILNSYSAPQEIDGYYVWETALSYGQTFNTRVEYSKDYFNPLSEKMQYTNKYITPFEKVMIILAVVLVIGVIVILVIYNRSKQDPYMRDRGFVRGYHHARFYYFRPYFFTKRVDSKGNVIVNPPTSSSSSHSSGGGCACACACACAGGGRAGCSKKDIYHTNLKSQQVLKTLNRKIKEKH